MNNCEILPGSLVFYLSGLRNSFGGNFLVIQWLGLQEDSILGWRTKITQVMWCRQIKKKKLLYFFHVTYNLQKVSRLEFCKQK